MPELGPSTRRGACGRGLAHTAGKTRGPTAVLSVSAAAAAATSAAPRHQQHHAHPPAHPDGSSTLPVPSPCLPGQPSPRRAPQRPHVLTTSPDLLRRRAERQAADQDLTRRLTACTTVAQAQLLYDSHGERFNAIHFAAMFTTLSRLASGGSSGSTRGRGAARDPAAAAAAAAITGTARPSPLHAAAPAPDAPASHTIPALQRPAHPHAHAAAGLGLSGARQRAFTPAEAASLQRLVAERLVPHVGLRLMGMGPRQMVTVLGALVALRCPPPAFWLAEWAQLFARRLGAAEEAGARAAAEVAAASRAGAGARGAPAAGGAQGGSACTPRDLALAMWALAQLQPAAGPNATDAAPQAAWRAAPRQGGGARGGGAALASGSATGAAGSSGGGGGSGGYFISSAWLDGVAGAMATRADTCTAADLAAYLHGAARLGYRPPQAALSELLRRCGWLLARQRMGPRELCGVLWALVALGYRPPAEWLGAASTEIARMAGVEVAQTAEGAPGAAAAALPLPRATRGAAAAMAGSSAGAGGVAEAPEAGASGGSGSAEWWHDHLGGAPAAAPPQQQQQLLQHGPAARARLDPRQAATCAWALARLRCPLPRATLRALVRATCGARVISPPHTPSSSASASSSSSARAQASTLFLFTTTPSSQRLPALAPGPTAVRVAPQDVTMLAAALAAARGPLPAPEAAALLGRMALCAGAASGQDVAVWAVSLARLRLRLPRPWAAVYFAAAEAALPRMAPRGVVDWMAAVAALRLAPTAPPRREQEQGCAATHRRSRQLQRLPGRRPLPALWDRGGRGGEAATAAMPGPLLQHVARTATATLPYLGLADLCRLTAAAAALHLAVGPRWVEAVVLRCVEELSRSAAPPPPPQQQQQQQQGCSDGGHWAAAAPKPGTSAGLAAAGGVPGVRAGLLVRLVCGVAELLQRKRGPRVLLPHRPRVAAGRGTAAPQQHQHRHQHRKLPHLETPRGSSQAGIPRGYGGDKGTAAAGTQAARRRGPPVLRRRWVSLLLTALLPQLPSLTTQQLLQLVRGLVMLRGGARLQRARNSQRRLAARLWRYCRRRVAATCGGGEQGCDVDTAGLLRWTARLRGEGDGADGGGGAASNSEWESDSEGEAVAGGEYAARGRASGGTVRYGGSGRTVGLGARAAPAVGVATGAAGAVAGKGRGARAGGVLRRRPGT